MILSSYSTFIMWARPCNAYFIYKEFLYFLSSVCKHVHTLVQHILWLDTFKSGSKISLPKRFVALWLHTPFIFGGWWCLLLWEHGDRYSLCRGSSANNIHSCYHCRNWLRLWGWHWQQLQLRLLALLPGQDLLCGHSRVWESPALPEQCYKRHLINKRFWQYLFILTF